MSSEIKIKIDGKELKIMEAVEYLAPKLSEEQRRLALEAADKVRALEESVKAGQASLRYCRIALAKQLQETADALKRP